MPQQVRVREDGVLVVDQGFRATGTPGTTSPLYGAGGLFGVCGADPVLVNACVNPIGIESWFEWVGSDLQSPMFDALTQIQSSGSGQTGMCSDCGKPTFRECMQSACFGRECQMTNEHAIDQIGLMMNRGVARMALFGNITAPDGTILVPQGQPISDMFTLELMGAAYNLRRFLGLRMWTGNPVNNLGGHWEFPGIQLIVNTGKFDAMTGIACDGLDSIMYMYNNVIGAVGAPSIVAAVAAVVRSSNYRMFGGGFNPASAEKALVVHPRHWDCLADAWACEYGLVCVNTTAAAPPRNDAMAIAKFRDDIRSRMAIPVDGEWIPVILDNQIPLVNVSVGTQNAFRGDLYYLVKRIDGRTIFWGEYQDLNATAGQVLSWFRQVHGSAFVGITDGGRFAVAGTSAGGFCFDARILTKTRLINIMPQFSGRVMRVTCIPTGSYPDVTGSGLTYEVGGGPSSKPYLGLYGYCGVLDFPA